MHDQKLLNKVFQDHKMPSIYPSMYTYSGYAICDKIKDDEFVLDVGCGPNIYKDRINNIVGIDPAHVNADVCSTIENYQTSNRYDVALVLGSINFGTAETIKKQIHCLIRLLKPKARIYWRCNPVSYSSITDEDMFFGWTFDLLEEYAAEFGFKMSNPQKDGLQKLNISDETSHYLRLYCEWHRN